MSAIDGLNFFPEPDTAEYCLCGYVDDVFIRSRQYAGADRVGYLLDEIDALREMSLLAITHQSVRHSCQSGKLLYGSSFSHFLYEERDVDDGGFKTRDPTEGVRYIENEIASWRFGATTNAGLCAKCVCGCWASKDVEGCLVHCDCLPDYKYFQHVDGTTLDFRCLVLLLERQTGITFEVDG